MRRPDLGDNKLLLLITLVLTSIIPLALKGQHYDLELQRIDERANELKSTIE